MQTQIPAPDSTDQLPPPLLRVQPQPVLRGRYLPQHRARVITDDRRNLVIVEFVERPWYTGAAPIRAKVTAQGTRPACGRGWQGWKTALWGMLGGAAGACGGMALFHLPHLPHLF